MGLIIHHLRVSQSDRIIWICEELDIPYELKCYDRDPVTKMAPSEYKALSSSQTAPVIQDGDITLAESSACIEYIINKYGNGKLMVKPSEPGYADFLFWWHYGQGTVQPAIFMAAAAAALPEKLRFFAETRRNDVLKNVNEQLGKTKYIAGNEFTAADIIHLFNFTTARLFFPVDLTNYPNIVRWIGEVGKRPAYLKALEKGDPGLEPILNAEGPKRG